MRAHLLRRWPSFKTHTALVRALKAEFWIPVGSKLDAPSNVLDPRNATLAFVFGGGETLLAAECAGEEWLAMLGDLGMKCAVDRDAFIQCARRVEQLGVLAAGAPPSPDTVARAEMLARHLAEHLTALTAEPGEEGDNDVSGPAVFCDAIKGLRFLPAHDPDAAAPPHGGTPRLCAFEEVGLHQDRRLLWTAAPLLRREHTPPRTHWAALGVLQPPPR